MGQARVSLLDSATSFPTRPEDRLTELVATVASACPAFAAALLELAGSAVGTSFEVSTQLVKRGTGNPDMEIVSRTGHRIVSRLWFEHKIDARDQPGQRERYVRALRDLDGGGRLLYIVRDVGRTRQEGEWTSVTWQQIGELADAVGRGSAPGGRHWRDDATKPGSVAQWRLLYELLWYLGYKELAVIDGLDNDHVAAYENLIETVETIDALLESAARQASPLLPTGADKNGVADFWEDFEVPQGGWLPRVIAFSPVAQLVVSDRVRWSYRGNNQPAFGAGYAMQEGASRLLEGHSGWLATLDERGFGFEVWDGWLCLFRTKLMSELTIGTGSLADQAKLLGGWASAAIIELGELDPGPLKTGQRGRGR